MTVTAVDGAVLTARLFIPPAPVGGIVVCHPHPLYGGDMDSAVVVTIAEAAARLGIATLRFNFRGVDGSTGAHDGGRAEQSDLEAAAATLRAALAVRAPLLVAGYSFGASVAAATAPRIPALAALVLVAPPIATGGRTALASLAGLTAPVLIVAGTDDTHCPVPALTRATTPLPTVTLHVLAHTDHFFSTTLTALATTVTSWLRPHVGKAGSESE